MTADRPEGHAQAPTRHLACDELSGLLSGATGDSLNIANEFTAVVVRRVDTRNGARLLIHSPKSGQWVSLDALETESLTWQNPATFAAMVGNVNAPLILGDDV